MGLWAIYIYIPESYLVLEKVLLILALSFTQIILAFLILIVKAGKIRVECVRNPLLHIILCGKQRAST